MSTIQARIKACMDVAGMTQTELAAETGLSRSNVCHMLHGRREPTVRTLAKVLRALPHDDARWIVCGEENQRVDT